MILRCLLVLILVGGALASTNGYSEEKQSALIVRPGAALVGTTTWPANPGQFAAILRAAAVAAAYDRAEYNENFREPTGGEMPHPVDCKDADSIAVAFLAGWRKGQRSSSTLKIRYDWQHSSIGGRAGKAKQFETQRDAFIAYDAKAERRRSIYVASLKLDDKRKADGIWTVTISFRGNELHREVFELSGCDG